MIKQISYDQILPLWEHYLWPNRIEKIEEHSAMLFLEGYDLKNFNYKPTFFGYFMHGILAGVNSGHLCMDNSYRSRGLFVFKNFRGCGIGQKLLTSTIEQGKDEKADFIWSYPRFTSWKTYEAVGFNLASDWKTTDNGQNAYCIINT